MEPDRRLQRLRSARLYFVCDVGLDPVELEALLGQALAGGADIVQLRDKLAPARALDAAASLFAAAAAEHEALFIVNDDPELARRSGADGVHVGQQDLAVAEARRRFGEPGVIGLSTHDPTQLEEAIGRTGPDLPDYLSVGPVWETPTKPGRPAAGLSYVGTAARRLASSSTPWFAIGGIDRSNAGQVRAAGAERFAVVRAIRDADDPRLVAAELRSASERAEATIDAGAR